MYLTGRMRALPGAVRPSTTLSTRGMPLPSACGSTRCTGQAAPAVAPAEAATTMTNPNSEFP